MLRVSNPKLSDRAGRTRAQILDAAWELVSKRGAEAGLAEIASAAGVTRQSVYVHFGSRGGLLMALLKRADERGEIFERFAKAMALSDPAERLDTCLGDWFRFVDGVVPVARDLIRLKPVDAEVAAAWDDRMADLLAAWQALTRSLSKDGALAAGWTPGRAADFLWVAASMQAYDLLTRERGWKPAKASAAIRESAARTLLV